MLPAALTTRDLAGLTLIAARPPSRELGNQLLLVKATFQFHTNRIFAGLGVRRPVPTERLTHHSGLTMNEGWPRHPRICTLQLPPHRLSLLILEPATLKAGVSSTIPLHQRDLGVGGTRSY